MKIYILGYTPAPPIPIRYDGLGPWFRKDSTQMSRVVTDREPNLSPGRNSYDRLRWRDIETCFRGIRVRRKGFSTSHSTRFSA